MRLPAAGDDLRQPQSVGTAASMHTRTGRILEEIQSRAICAKKPQLDENIPHHDLETSEVV